MQTKHLRTTTTKLMEVKMSEHKASLVKCDCCGHEWVAVRPKELVKLECPECMTLRFFDDV